MKRQEESPTEKEQTTEGKRSYKIPTDNLSVSIYSKTASYSIMYLFAVSSEAVA